MIMAISVRLGDELEARLENLAKKTGRTKTYYIKEAIIEWIEDMEDVYYAEKALREGGETVSLEEVMRENGLLED